MDVSTQFKKTQEIMSQSDEDQPLQKKAKSKRKNKNFSLSVKGGQSTEPRGPYR